MARSCFACHDSFMPWHDGSANTDNSRKLDDSTEYNSEVFISILKHSMRRDIRVFWARTWKSSKILWNRQKHTEIESILAELWTCRLKGLES
jgi:hypothetical protein